MSIRVLIADSQEMARLGLKSFLAGSEFEIVVETSTCNEAIYLAISDSPDVALISIRLLQGTGFSALQRIKQRQSDLPVILMSDWDDPGHLARAYRLGAAAFLTRSVDRESLRATINAVVNGDEFWTRDHSRRVSGVTPTSPRRGDADAILTPCEQEILRVLFEGLSNPQIAAELNVSYETVKKHVRNLLCKLCVADRTQAALWAIRNGLA